MSAREQANTFKKHRDAEDPQGNLAWATRLQNKALRAGPEALARIDVEREFDLSDDEKVIWRLLKLARKYIDLEHTGVLPSDKVRGFLRGLVAADVVDIVDNTEAKALIPAEIKRLRAELAGKELAKPKEPLKGKVYRPEIGAGPGPTAASAAPSSRPTTSSSAGFQTIPPESVARPSKPASAATSMSSPPRSSPGGSASAGGSGSGASSSSRAPPPVNLTPGPAPAGVSFATPPPSDSGALGDEDRMYKTEIERAYVAMAKQNHYEFMGLAPPVDDSAVRAAWMRLAREYHPDRVAGGALSSDTALRARVEALFRRLGEANEMLGGAETRSTYDRTLEALGEGSSAANAGKKQRRPAEANNAFRMAETFFKKKELKQAEAHFRQAVAFDGEDPKILTALAYCIWLNPDHDEAQRTAEAKKRLQDIVANYKYGDAAYKLGLMLRKVNDEAAAQRQFALAHKLDPSHVEAQREVRLADMRQAKTREAKEAEKGIFGKVFKK